MVKKSIFSVMICLMASFGAGVFTSCGQKQQGKESSSLLDKIESVIKSDVPDEYNPIHALLVLPCNPIPGEPFRIVATGGRNIKKAKLIVSGPAGELEAANSHSGQELPCWRIDDFTAASEGQYKVQLLIDDKEVAQLSFDITAKKAISTGGMVWKTTRGWDSATETLYSAWVNALFSGCNEQTSWKALHEATQDKSRNFLYNCLAFNEDDASSKIHVLMEPDCADNPFFLRAYFAWKLGLPFGYHVCDRGYIGKNPSTGQWITNETASSKTHPTLAFNSFIRRVMDGVHSGTGRVALDNENADYYPVALDRASLRPGTVFADPYGHTFILVSWLPQTDDQPGVLLAVDAQPDKTVAIKRFWKGNFLFATSEVVGEPGFKAFRPIAWENGKIRALKNEELTAVPGLATFSLQQRKMESEAFYHAMERLINPQPLDPEAALSDLIKALHEQLLVRVKSVANGETYLQQHPGTIIPMPGNANGVFLAGGQWEEYSTPNRDLRLLIAMDAVIGFPERVAKYPDDYNISKLSSVDDVKNKLQKLLDEQVAKLTITYTRSDGSEQTLTVAEILKRRDAFEMNYNPNDGVEIRWGAPEGSAERSTCRRQAPAGQQKTMQAVRKWFNKRLHPPT